MSRIARKPLELPTAVDVQVEGNLVSIKGKKGTLKHTLRPQVKLNIDGNLITVLPSSDSSKIHPMVGTTRILLGDMVKGVNEGFELKLQLIGVGYRAKVQASVLELSLGFSHPVNFPIPEGIVIETPVNTEIIIKGIDKQLVGQVAANIRRYRQPESYKGKGIRYSLERD